MNTPMKITRLVVAGAAAGLLGLAGVSLASAQEEPSTTTTPEAQEEAPSTAPDDGGDRDCPEKGSDGSSSASDTTSET